ncbi:MAG: hypothetical protein EXR65_02665 [Dehalococcoidia bacterium]|nr:hypothetical protein [Dehalococcoidia bacterium]
MLTRASRSDNAPLGVERREAARALFELRRLGALAALAAGLLALAGLIPLHHWLAVLLLAATLVTEIGRELRMARENARLRRDALDGAMAAALLSDVNRALGASDAAKTLGDALALAGTRMDAMVVALLRRPERSALPQRLALYARHRGDESRDAIARALHGAPALVSDRWHPLVLGEGGEAPLSHALAAAGVGTMVLAPVLCFDVDRAGAAPPHGSAPETGIRQTIAATLCVMTPCGARWGSRHVELLSHLSHAVARRLEVDALLRLRERREAKISGLAEVAMVVQSTIDPERLYSGFARAVRSLVAYGHLYIALLAAGGSLRDAQEMLGHSSYTLTADLYVHVLAAQRQATADRIDQAFGAAIRGA